MTVLLDDIGPGGRDGDKQFILPPDREATSPPEARGLARDAVRLLVSDPSSGAGDTLTHAIFHELPRYLRPGDLLVVNDSATLPAALDAHGPDGTPVTVHFATWLDDGSWVVEVRTRDGAPSDWSGLTRRRRFRPARWDSVEARRALVAARKAAVDRARRCRGSRHRVSAP